MNDSILEQIQVCGVVAVIRMDDYSAALPLAKALAAGGVTVIEFTLTNPQAVEAVAAVRESADDAIIVGAGSVLTAEQAQQMIDAGAQFVVSPVTDAAVIATCKQAAVPVMPGAYTPTEIQTAWEMGADVVKVFPARGLGAAYIKDVLAPLPHLRLMPTGGISAGTIPAYVKAGVFAVGVGGALVDSEAIATGDWQVIIENARACANAYQEAYRQANRSTTSA